jgi:hypothetical protein
VERAGHHRGRRRRVPRHLVRCVIARSLPNYILQLPVLLCARRTKINRFVCLMLVMHDKTCSERINNTCKLLFYPYNKWVILYTTIYSHLIVLCTVQYQVSSVALILYYETCCHASVCIQATYIGDACSPPHSASPCMRSPCYSNFGVAGDSFATGCGGQHKSGGGVWRQAKQAHS